MASDDKPRIIVLDFWTKIKTKNGESVEEDWVRYAPAHSPQNTQNEEAVHRLRPSERLMRGDDSPKKTQMIFIWDAIKDKYAAWKSGEELPEHGTSIKLFTLINEAQREAFIRQGIRTIEDLAAMTDPQAEKISLPNVRKTRELAQKFLDGQETSKALEREAARDEEIAAMRAQIEELTREKQAAIELLEEANEAPDEALSRLRKQCDDLGIEYHHKAGPAKLQSLIDEHTQSKVA